LSILSEKIEKAKGIVEAGKNISALQEERDVLKAQLESANTAHKEAMAEAKNTHAAEIQSLKDLVARQDERLRMQEEDGEASRKSFEDSMVTLRKELDNALAQLDSVDVELRSKFLLLVAVLFRLSFCAV
jgi:chromosome segregation ATPase